ncbi:hypothetical protein M427DRAFT_37545 [Gonapodya prolifera JEL478]|uniref:Uncharacterized protein n=1 Tax=Gonapodya prolifera (strain JEL478) TaxID=1344416 RepID=A0A139A0I5_GONPJ|nr:hypothetical protein M427DRAFT_37545 [Gonapodya prolifera JEL478]|eukprot:KXS10271.1 hypothetical protein M427DRAFT_37545 [Gonapodya prolifera JEL478]
MTNNNSTSTLIAPTIAFHADTIKDLDTLKRLEQWRNLGAGQLMLTDMKRKQESPSFDEALFWDSMLDWVAVLDQPLTEPSNKWFLRLLHTDNPDLPQLSLDMLSLDARREL